MDDISELSTNKGRGLVCSVRPLTVIGLWLACFTLLTAILLPLLQQARESARRNHSANNLKQIGLALHNYHDIYSMLPPGGSIRADGTPHHGWATSIMPYLDASPAYSMIDFDQAWDHPSNLSACSSHYMCHIDPVKRLPLESDELCLIKYMANPALLHRNSSIAFRDMDGGTAQNWLVGEVAGGFQPASYPFNWREWDATLNQSTSGFGGKNKRGTNFLIADGRVEWVSTDGARVAWKNYSRHQISSHASEIAIPPRTFPED